MAKEQEVDRLLEKMSNGWRRHLARDTYEQQIRDHDYDCALAPTKQCKACLVMLKCI